MAATSQIESGGEILANALDIGLRPGNLISGSYQTISNYTALGDARQIVNNGMITIERLTNNYAGPGALPHSEDGALLKCLIGSEDNIRQQRAIIAEALHSRDEHSGKWLWNVSAFKDWLGDQSRMIWIHGGGEFARASRVVPQF